MSLASFATLGDGGKKAENKTCFFPKTYTSTNSKHFSLKTQFNYRGNQILSNTSSERFIMLNTVVTYQKGNTTYILPMKKKVLLDRVKFNPAP
ncbi:hypothetical protein V9K67_02505 [Paraflavisolibacter sp. H34]|uniref:hypothetical protein n=1 Tax=Huijunlia imazamoxiresistens TaxID=3127457 RepID=UPI003019DB50